MVSFTLIALVVAGAGALGYFDADKASSPPQREVLAPKPTLVPYKTPLAFLPAEPLTVTYFLVDNEDELHAYEHYEDDMIFREILQKDAIEILLIRNDEEEARANRTLEVAKARAEASGFILVVQDLR